MKINTKFIEDYKKIIQTTNLQKGYQEFVKFFRGFRTYLADNLTEYKFTGNIVENNMDYSYFQFSSDALQSKGLKFVIAFIHDKFEYEIWLSGMNRKIQISYHGKLIKVKHKYTMSPDPNRFDYVLKERLFDKVNYDDCEKLFNIATDNVKTFTQEITKLIFEVNL
ncbi:hypothetical protein JW962_00235 [Candidatus Dojkabacteria bacterium]|nr:hypothetical protein [Candidatus Dojkabacteria bacterium]